jgi:N-methylhydantoinase A
VDVLPEQREYERTSTAVVNAYVLPVMRDYLAALGAGLEAMGIAAPLLVANSNGGLARAAVAMEKPVFFVSSGRAAGAAGAAALGRSMGQGDLVAFDMGGTTASAALVAGGVLSRTTEYEFRAGISTPSRFIKAGGYLMRVPTVDVAEIGSGGGSIAHVDAGGLISVGPRSAGAVPGPACYGGGGTLPTVTDANLVLGFLPDRLAGGSVTLDRAAAFTAIEREVARPLRLTVEAAAFGIRAVVNAGMARAIRAVTVERGVDPRDFTLLAFGGSGPNHACDLARMLDIHRVLFPPAPGVFTALGMLSGAIEHFFIRSFPGALDALDAPALLTATEAMAAEARDELAAEGLDPAAARFDFGIDLRFAGQDSELRIAFDPSRLDTERRAFGPRFLAQYRETYGYASQGRIEAVNLRLTASAEHGEIAGDSSPQTRPPEATRAPEPVGTRPIRFARDEDPMVTPVYLRDGLAGALAGPCAIESADTTIILPPGAAAECDPGGNILVRLDD